MSVSTKITCDVPGCDVQKQESNHWVMFAIVGKEVTFAPWDENDYHSWKHACGAGCASKVLSMTIAGWSQP